MINMELKKIVKNLGLLLLLFAAGLSVNAQQTYVGSVTVGVDTANDGVCFETTYILADGDAVVANNTTGIFGPADGAAFDTPYDVYAFTYNMCALGFMAPTIPTTVSALDPSMDCGTLSVPFAVEILEPQPVVCTASGDDLRVGFSGWFTDNSQRYILTNANNGGGTVLQVNNTGVFASSGLASGDYFVCAINLPPADVAIVDGSVGSTLGALEDACSSLMNSTSYFTDCTQVSVVDAPAITLNLPAELCTQVGEFDLNGFASPAGGTWDVSNLFDPSTAGVGMYSFTYTFDDGTCVVSETATINVIDDCLLAGTGAGGGGIPTVSEWGLICLSISLLSMITIYVRRKNFSLVPEKA